jgi:hypothetical protein
VVGRHVVRVRICSCPKRDMNQELESLSNDYATGEIARAKKRKVESNPMRIKPEGFSAVTPNMPAMHNYCNNGANLALQPRLEPLNYMEV